MPHVRTVELADAHEIDWRAVGWKRPGAPAPLIHVGTPGPRQKAVIHLADPASGECDAIVKVPLTPGARDAIIREAAVLEMLAGEGYTCAPHVLRVHCERDLAAQQFLPGMPAQRRPISDYYALLRSLMLHDEYTNIAEQVTAWHEPFHVPDRQLMASVGAELADAVRLPACWVHGDFAPWNIRTLPGGQPALIDWEDAARGGLPLHDAWHFLHMQDFLFRGRPAAHFPDLGAFGRGLGLSWRQCRKLEIAYLARSYARCVSEGEHRRAEFLHKTLALVLRDRASSYGTTERHVSSRAEAGASVRTELLSAVIAQLNAAGIPYCILSGDEGAPQSDIDIMFRPQDLHRLPDLLGQAAGSAGALLVQSFQHETTACFLILARRQGGQVVHLDLDCYSHYRRNGRNWLLAGEVMEGRRELRGRYIPSVGDEFTYYLLKKVLKQSINRHQLKRLQALLAKEPAECRGRIAKFWRPETAPRLERAILQQDIAWFQGQLPELLRELRKSSTAAGPGERLRETLRELGRLKRRFLFPTGMLVVLDGGDRAQRAELAEGLVCQLERMFRRTSKCSLPQTLAQALKLFGNRVRSTLVVASEDCDRPACTPGRRLNNLAARFLLRPDLVLRMPTGGAADASCRCHRVIHLAGGRSLEQMTDDAVEVILQWLAFRAEGQWRPTSHQRRGPHHASETTAEARELTSVGFD
ncbi:MAG TPA: aminoglycoside phosphotransferase family protein [Candidatus Binatia bacterium]|nr:aminoglycoside phosphotransferase family protein [Candidatus Binatia bacterium]